MSLPLPDKGTDLFPDKATDTDLAILEEQIGRTPRGVVAVGARCVCSRPLVVVTQPRLEDGTPFPTIYYLTHPAVVHGCSVLEAEGLMAEFTQEIADNEELAAAYRRAHEAYIAERNTMGEVPEIAGVSAGGMPTRVKCLHALVGHALSAGPGVNPIGDRTLAILKERGLWSPDTCACKDTSCE